MNHIIKKLVSEVVHENILNETVVDLDKLRNNISHTTEIGRKWYKFIEGLEGVTEETIDFKNLYSSSQHGALPTTDIAAEKLKQMIKLCEEIKPIIIGMSEIERRDNGGR